VPHASELRHPQGTAIGRRHVFGVCDGGGNPESLVEQGLNDPSFDPELNELVDLRSVTEFALSSDEIRTFARRRIYSPESRRALVASSPHIFGLGRMWEAYTAPVG
jgi:hypothetical protein